MSQARSPVDNASRVIAASRALTTPDAHACTTSSLIVVAKDRHDRVGTLDAGQIQPRRPDRCGR